ncbi:pre-mRNA processing factor PRP3, partial [Toxoplasma gondii VEG]
LAFSSCAFSSASFFSSPSVPFPPLSVSISCFLFLCLLFCLLLLFSFRSFPPSLRLHFLLSLPVPSLLPPSSLLLPFLSPLSPSPFLAFSSCAFSSASFFSSPSVPFPPLSVSISCFLFLCLLFCLLLLFSFRSFPPSLRLHFLLSLPVPSLLPPSSLLLPFLSPLSPSPFLAFSSRAFSSVSFFSSHSLSLRALLQRKRKALEFVEAGRYIQQEQQMLHHHHAMEKRAEREREREHGGESQSMKGRPAGDGAHADAQCSAPAAGSPVQKEEDEQTPEFSAKIWAAQPPSVEPWDACILKVDASRPDEILPQEDALDNLVEHPVPVRPVLDASTNVIINMYLTKQERKKLRRRKRQEKEREKQDKIRMGLMPPPPPKVKLTNLMRVLGDQAVADPSKVEKEVREQMEKRLKDHEARNEARKLAPEVRSKKHAAKWQKKPHSGEFHVLLFCLKDLTNKRHLYKVDINAQQLHLAGVAVICPSSLKTIVVVEGSLISIKRFRSLMMRRIKWRELEGSTAVNDDDDDEDEKPEADDESCCLVWQGTVRTNSFSGWKIHRVAGEADGRKIFKLAHVEHYWDMAQKYRHVSNDL